MGSKKHLILSRQLAFESDYTLTPDHIDLIRVATFINFKELLLSGNDGVITFDFKKYRFYICGIIFIANSICEYNNIDINEVKGNVSIEIPNISSKCNQLFLSNIKKSFILLHNIRNCIRHKNFTIKNRCIVISDDALYEDLKGIEIPIFLFDYLNPEKLPSELKEEYIFGLQEFIKKILNSDYSKNSINDVLNRKEILSDHDEYYAKFINIKKYAFEYSSDLEDNKKYYQLNNFKFSKKYVKKYTKTDDRLIKYIYELMNINYGTKEEKTNGIIEKRNLDVRRLIRRKEDFLDVLEKITTKIDYSKTSVSYEELADRIKELRSKQDKNELKRATDNLLDILSKVLEEEAIEEEIAYIDLYLLFISIDLEHATKIDMERFNFSKLTVEGLPDDVKKIVSNLRNVCKSRLKGPLNEKRIQACMGGNGLENVTNDLMNFYYTVLSEISIYNGKVVDIIKNSTAHGHLKLEDVDVVFTDYVAGNTNGDAKVARINRQDLEDMLKSLDSTSEYKVTMNIFFSILSSLIKNSDLVNKIRETFRNIYMANYVEEPDFNKTFEELFGSVLELDTSKKGLGEV